MRKTPDSSKFMFMSGAFVTALGITASVYKFFGAMPVELEPPEIADATGIIFMFGCILKGFRDLERDRRPAEISIRWAAVAGGATGIAMAWSMVAGQSNMPAISKNYNSPLHASPIAAEYAQRAPMPMNRRVGIKNICL